MCVYVYTNAYTHMGMGMGMCTCVCASVYRIHHKLPSHIKHDGGFATREGVTVVVLCVYR